MKDIIIIGSGFSSLAASCYLAKAGYNVKVIEKNSTVGGRARQYFKDGFKKDIINILEKKRASVLECYMFL